MERCTRECYELEDSTGIISCGTVRAAEYYENVNRGTTKEKEV
jgi:hypothetical protein